MSSTQLFLAEIPATIRLTSSLLAELIVTCLRDLSEPVVTSKLSGDLLTHLRAASEGHVKLYVVKCLLEDMPEQQYGDNVNTHCFLLPAEPRAEQHVLYCLSMLLAENAHRHEADAGNCVIAVAHCAKPYPVRLHMITNNYF